ATVAGKQPCGPLRAVRSELIRHFPTVRRLLVDGRGLRLPYPERYAAVGIHLPRVAVDQFNAAVPSPIRSRATSCSVQPREPGSHTVRDRHRSGIHISALTTERVVSVASVFTGYWGNHHAGVGRVRL